MMRATIGCSTHSLLKCSRMKATWSSFDSSNFTSCISSAQEMQLVKLLLSNDDHVAFIREHFKSEWVEHPIVARIIQRRIASHTDAALNAAAFLSEFNDDPAAQSLISETLADQRPIPQPEKQLADVLLHLRNDFLTQQLQALTHRLAQPETSD